MNDIIVMIGKIGGNMNRRGQALVEFVLILPVLIFVLFAIIDFGNIFSTKNSLEGDSSDIIELFNDGKSLEEIKNIFDDRVISISDNGDYYRIIVSDSIKLITPGFNRVFGNPYVVKIERVVPHA